MARKVKIDNSTLKRIERKEAKRQKETKQKRKKYLIVCEGEKTEPNYFDSLKKSLPRGVLNVVDFKIIGEGFNTESLVKRAIQLRNDWEKESNNEIDKLWVVFDKDSFSPLIFNNAIQLCRNTDRTEAAWSNEAFELWYLLHFEFYNTAMSRSSYSNKIQKCFRDKGLTTFNYSKNSTEMFKLLSDHGDINLAIKRAKRLEASYSGQNEFANQNPCTTVYKLVVELFNLENLLKTNDDNVV